MSDCFIIFERHQKNIHPISPIMSQKVDTYLSTKAKFPQKISALNENCFHENVGEFTGSR